MPRRTAGRTSATEKALAQRIQEERTTRRMSYAGLARRMTQAGCAIDQSAIQKIEKGDPPRRITVDELVALAQVFDLPLDELLLPVAESKARAVAVAVTDLNKARFTIEIVLEEAERRLQDLRPLLPYVDGWRSVDEKLDVVAEALRAVRTKLIEESDAMRDAFDHASKRQSAVPRSPVPSTPRPQDAQNGQADGQHHQAP